MFNLLYKISRRVPKASRILRILYSCDIPRKAKIGKNVTFNHDGIGTVIHPDVIIEDNVFIGHHVTIGRRNGRSLETPVIHKNAIIGAYAIILGNVDIGENTRIGAGSLVMHDVPANTLYYNERIVHIEELEVKND